MVSALLLLLASSGPLHDPTEPLAPPTLNTEPVSIHAPASAVPDFTLHAIFSGGHTSAIINNQRLVVGDTIQHYNVLRITASDVVLQGPKQTLTLTLFPSL
ncbi:hypothetical protein [Oceanisphaera avium]|uniref:MSHA biogenesis protein MshK n=1 Tax=Oceanisphaera avium TaxID=1903694 RepID=A0A1Y0CV73_9GAMM|nr:hypothetical protein [Oceanisphaera avium]ART79240.1 hypothetical protein CBP12_03005 [Oceanisphaera avium]